MTALALLDALEANLTPRFTIEPPDKGDALEATRQLAFRRHMRLAAPGVLVVAVPNGTHIASHAGRAKANAEGRHKGAFDLLVYWNHGHAALEFKSGRGAVKPAQIEYGNRLVEMGHRCAVVRSVPFALALLREWGAPVR